MSDRIEVFKQLLESEPDNPMVLFGLANEYLKAKNFLKAIKVLEVYLKLGTDEGAAYGMLAKAYEATGGGEKAKFAYEKGIEVSLANGHPSMAEDYRSILETNYQE